MSQELKNLVELKEQLLDSVKAVEKEIEKRQIFTERGLGKYGFKLKSGNSRYKLFIKQNGKDKVEITTDIIHPTEIVLIKDNGIEELAMDFNVKSEEELVKLLTQAKVL